jgi:hypothetical protein
MLPTRWFGCLVVSGLIVAAGGCDTGPRLSPVTGTVTLDGAPVPEGDILFTPADPNLSPEAGKIKDGKYEIKSREGKMKVQINASKIVPGAAKGAMGEDVATEYIPSKYNTQTTLSADVKAGPNTFDFPLESK